MLTDVTEGGSLSTPALTKYLIVNADDFGQCYGINRGIMTAHHHGIVTSASLMVRWPAAGEAVAYAREHPGFSLGLHVDLGEKIFRAGEWLPVYTVVPLENMAAVSREVARQLDVFRHLMDRDPSHLDSHQHVHLREPVHTILVDIAERLGIPLRQRCAHVGYQGSFYGQTAEGAPVPDVISVDGLIRILESLPTGCTELGCHPAESCDLETMYRSERQEELRVLCDARVRSAIQKLGIELRSFTNTPNGH